MASVSWTQSTSGSWSAANAWSTGGVPTQSDSVTIAVASVTVTYGAGALAIDSLYVGTASLLDVTGGSLAVTDGYYFGEGLTQTGGSLRLRGGAGGDQLGGSGTVALSGGTLTLINGALSSGGTLTQTAGTVVINGGTFYDAELNSSLAGTFNGGGVLVLDSGQTTLNKGLALNVAAVDLSAGVTTLSGALSSLSYGGRFVLGGGVTLSLSNDVLTLTGSGALDGIITNSGTVIEAGVGILNGLALNNGSQVNISGSVNQTGQVVLGGATSSGTLDITSSNGTIGTLRITGNDSIAAGSGGGALTNSGLIIKTGGSRIASASYITTALQNFGTITAAVGAIDFAGPQNASAVSIIAGTLSGAGLMNFSQGYYAFGNTVFSNLANLQFSGSNNTTFTSAESYTGNWVQTGGLLLVDNTLTLAGAAAFDGGELKGTATVNFAAGTALHFGAGMDLEGNLSFNMNGPVVQTGYINLGALSDSVDQATLSAGNSWALEGSAGINGQYGTITNNGLFEKLDGAALSSVASDFINTAGGTLLINAGTLAMIGRGLLDGTVAGNAVLDIGGAYQLGTSLALSVGEVILDPAALVTLNSNFTYANIWANEGGTLVLNGLNQQNVLTLNGATTLIGEFSGDGLVVVNGATEIGSGQAFQLQQGADLTLNGFTEQSGNLLMASGVTAPTLTVGTGGVYQLDPGWFISSGPGNSPVGDLVVNGTLNASGVGTTTINATTTINGAVNLSYGEMDFLGPLSGAGKITISAGGTLALDNNASITSNINFGTGGGLLFLDYPNNFAGTINNFASGDVVELNGFSFLTANPMSVQGKTVTLSESTGQSVTLTFSTVQTQSQLMLGAGPHGDLTLIHI